jgi:outer membrane lipoprotein SlyB
MKRLPNILMSLATLAGIAALAVAPGAFAACKECGTVTDVKTIKKEGQGSGLGLVAGGVVGGVLGHQVGHGRGKDVATVAGAAGGAYAGNQIEKNANAVTEYHVIVTMDDGSSRTFKYKSPVGYKTGDAVKVVDGKLIRQ